jgi:hypothetical protein
MNYRAIKDKLNSGELIIANRGNWEYLVSDMDAEVHRIRFDHISGEWMDIPTIPLREDQENLIDHYFAELVGKYIDEHPDKFEPRPGIK